LLSKHTGPSGESLFKDRNEGSQKQFNKTGYLGGGDRSTFETGNQLTLTEKKGENKTLLIPAGGRYEKERGLPVVSNVKEDISSQGNFLLEEKDIALGKKKKLGVRSRREATKKRSKSGGGYRFRELREGRKRDSLRSDT